MKHTLRVLFILISCSVVAGQIFAQEDSTVANSLTNSAMALQFGIRNAFTLSTFQGGTIAMQYHLSPTSAFRGGITVSGSTGDRTTNSLMTQSADTISGNSGSRSQDATSVILDLQYLWYANPDNEMLLYLGTGPHVGYTHSRDDQTVQFVTQPSTYGSASNLSTLWSIGLSGVVGVEWFPQRRISLHAEYMSFLRYEWQKSEATSSQTGSTSKSSDTAKTWRVGYAGVNFGLSVYFH